MFLICYLLLLCNGCKSCCICGDWWGWIEACCPARDGSELKRFSFILTGGGCEIRRLLLGKSHVRL